MKKNFPLFFILIFFYLFLTSARAEVSPLKIQAFPDQNAVDAGMMFLVHMQVANPSPDSSTGFWANNCSYEKHWVTDNPGVFIQPWTCEENALEEITLGPGETYEKDIMLYISKKDRTGPVTFRLGFKRMSESGDVAEPLWSDPVTVKVTVPEEMKETVPDAGSTSQVTADPPLVFQDPGVPIQVRPGDEFSISLTSNPSTGYLWKMTLPEGDPTVTFLGSEHIVSQTGMMGAPGQEVFKFKAVTAGETKADFVYKRPWETVTAPPRKIFTILVQEN